MFPPQIVRPHRARAPRRVRAALAALALVLLGAPGVLRAQQPPVAGAADSGADTSSEASPMSPDSPRAAVAAFLRLTAAGDDERAGAYLVVPRGSDASAGELARELAAVLAQDVWIDLDEISGLPGGDTNDGLSAPVEQIATIETSSGRREPVRLVHVAGRSGPAWRFSSATVARVPEWYADIDGRWAREHLPAVLLHTGPWGIRWWQWLALPVLLVLAAGLGRIVSRIVCGLLGRTVRRTSATWDDILVERLGGPITLAAMLIIAEGLLTWLALDAAARAGVGRVLHAGLFVAFFWGLWRFVDVLAQVITLTRWVPPGPGGRSLLSLLSRAAKVAVVAIAIVAVLSTLGYPVAGLLTGLGLGGLAFALAAQKTVENLFGAVSIGLDRPFREGDFVKIEDFVGTVETIGLRSTRVRTLDRTLITMPNGKLADMRIESFAVRDRLRLSAVIGLVYQTTAAQMREVLEGFERVLRAQPKIWPDGVTARFSQFSPSSLDIEVMAWFETSDWAEFQLIRQDVLLQFMEVVERAGTSFAYPTRTVILEGGNGQAGVGGGHAKVVGGGARVGATTSRSEASGG
ncbi:MAG TPA: mechanosensitive ion channel domain-containing protein [Gemmatimonadaceae bacterium]